MVMVELFLGFLKVGLFSFGGAYGAIPLIRDIVLSYGWLEEEMLTYMIAVSESTPGPIMVNLATYIGSSQAGLPGAVIATCAVVLPSFTVILLVTAWMKTALKSPWVQAALRGVKPCMAGIILATGLFMLLKNCLGTAGGLSLQPQAALLTAFLALLYFGAAKIKKNAISPILFIALAAVGGILVYGAPWA